MNNPAKLRQIRSILLLVAVAVFLHTSGPTQAKQAQVLPEETLILAEVAPVIIPEIAPLPQIQAAKAKPETSKPLSVKPSAKPAAPPTTSLCAGSLEAEFLCLINDYRTAHGLNKLSINAKLTATAQSHAAWMNANKIMDHIGESGSKFYERCTAHGTTCDGENVAMGYTTAQKLFTAWKNSPGHNANMLGNHTQMGLSLVGKYSTLLLK